MNGPELQEFIDRYNAAWNDRDVESIVEMHTDDSVHENHTAGDLNVGRDEIRTGIRGIFTAFPDLEFETRRQYLREDLVVREWMARGTHLGKMSRGGIEVEPTGNPIEYRGVDVISVEGGRVARLDVYADGVTLLRQLGLIEVG